jgi:hypothetical protein
MTVWDVDVQEMTTITTAHRCYIHGHTLGSSMIYFRPTGNCGHWKGLVVFDIFLASDTCGEARRIRWEPIGDAGWRRPLPRLCAGSVFFVAARCLQVELWLLIAMLAVPSGAACRCWQSLAELLVDLMFTCRKRSDDWLMWSSLPYLFSGCERVGAGQASAMSADWLALGV